MRFWDSSAIVPLLAAEPSTAAVESAYGRDPQMTVWWGTEIECVSAISRRERLGTLAIEEVPNAFEALEALALGWNEVDPGSRVREVANRLLRTHPLRAADAMQLATALIAAEERPANLPLVTLDDRLADAARREGFAVEVPGAP